MLSTVLAVIGIDLKREVKNISVTVVFAILGAFLTVLAVAIALRALYLWLELRLGVFPALWVLWAAVPPPHLRSRFQRLQTRMQTFRQIRQLGLSDSLVLETDSDATMHA